MTATEPAANADTEDPGFLCRPASQSIGTNKRQACVLVGRLMAKLETVALMQDSLATIEFVFVDKSAVSTRIYKVISAGQTSIVRRGVAGHQHQPLTRSCSSAPYETVNTACDLEIDLSSSTITVLWPSCLPTVCAPAVR